MEREQRGLEETEKGAQKRREELVCICPSQRKIDRKKKSIKKKSRERARARA